jgi:hypothetical protein
VDGALGRWRIGECAGVLRSDEAGGSNDAGGDDMFQSEHTEIPSIKM